MIEIGCFLCGSTRQWLESRSDLIVIGVDPWDGNWANYITTKTAELHGSMRTLDDPAAVTEALVEYGNFRVALNNVRAWCDRFIPLRQWSPQALHYLKQRGIWPEMIYIDAHKEEQDLRVAHELFPDAVLCGDDWDWPDPTGELIMQTTLRRFADDRGFDIEAEGATWLLNKKVQSGRAVTPPKQSSPERTIESSSKIRRAIARATLDRFAGVLDRSDLANVDLLVLGFDADMVHVLLDDERGIGRFVGLSADTDLVERLRREVTDPRFEFQAARFPEGLPLDERRFDLICAVSVFDHLDPDGYRSLLAALGRHATSTTRLAYTALLDELTPGGWGAIDAFVRALGTDVASTTHRFQDFLPDEPLRMALYERSYARELLEEAGWTCRAIEDPVNWTQHLLIAERAQQE